MIIDFHTHTFPDKIANRVVHQLAQVSHTKPFTDGTLSNLVSSMEEASIDWSVNLPVMTTPAQVDKINNKMIDAQEEHLSKGIISFGGLHPEYEPYKEELFRLKSYGIKGIKLHPAYQHMDLDNIQLMRIIDAASDLGLITLLHAGMDIGILDRNYSSVKHILKLLDEVQPEKLVLAHMGNWDCWDDVENYLVGAPVWFDTAFSIGPITKYPGDSTIPYRTYNMKEEHFLRLARKHGMNKILFATDSPWQEQKDYVNLINTFHMFEAEKEAILYKNAALLLQIHI